MPFTTNITEQDAKVLNHLVGKSEVFIEDLAPLTKTGTTKVDSLRKIVSDLKRKYILSGLPVPFNCKIISRQNNNSVPQQDQPIQVRKTRGGRLVPVANTTPDAHIDFVLEPYYRRVKTRNRVANLSDREWEVFVYFYNNVGKKISLEELRNDVVYKHFGSKTPHNWADSIRTTIGKLRQNIPELKTENRLSTLIGTPTYYMFD